MNKKKQNRSMVLPLIRVTPREKKQIKEAYLGSPYPNQSAFIRAKLLDENQNLIAAEVFSQVLLMGEIADLLDTIGDRIVQIIKLRKEEGTSKMNKKETQLFAEVLKNIQQVQSNLLKKEEG